MGAEVVAELQFALLAEQYDALALGVRADQHDGLLAVQLALGLREGDVQRRLGGVLCRRRWLA